MIHAFTILTVVVAVATVSAQNPPATAPMRFEVASVRPNPDARLLRFSILPGGQFIVQGYTLASIIQHAFNVSEVQIVGMPEWARTERFDITAKAAEGSTGGSAQVLGMLRALLQERFSLHTRNEARELPIYALSLAREDRKPGPQLLPSDLDCDAFVPGRLDVPEPNAGPRCAIYATGSAASSATTFRMRGRTMAKLASDLQVFARRPVRNDTGLAGRFDVELTFTPQLPDSPPPVGSEGISLFTAVQEQLGLRLESTRGNVDVLVIDALDRSTAN